MDEGTSFFKTILGFEETDARKWFESNKNCPRYQILNDDKIISSVTKSEFMKIMKLMMWNLQVHCMWMP